MADEMRNINSHQIVLQLNPSNSDPNGTEESVHIKVASNVLGGEKLVLLERCPHFRERSSTCQTGCNSAKYTCTRYGSN